MPRAAVIFVGVALGLHGAMLVGQAPVPQLLQASSANVTSGTGVKRSRTVKVAAASIDTAPASVGGGRAIELNLFDDVRYIADLRRLTAPGSSPGISWGGVLRDQPGSAVLLTNRGGIVAASIRTNDGRNFQIRYSGDGDDHVVQEVDQAALPQDAPPRRPPEGVPPGAADLLPAAAGDACADDTTIDVAVAYTPAALKQAGGINGMNTLIDLAVAETNKGYEDSGITQRVRVVHRVELAYDESAGYDQALNDITGIADGKMDNIHTLRDKHKADMVSLWIAHDRYCGLAWLLDKPSRPFADRAFSVVNVRCAAGYYSFGHEMGHNQGAEHDRDNAVGQGAFPHSYCLRNGAQAPFFRTIMAYACADGVDCPRINQWSNPEVSYSGLPTGVAVGQPNAADNRLTLNNTRRQAARWRRSAP